MTTVALLAYRGMDLSVRSGGAERSFREDIELLREAGHRVETWAGTPLRFATSDRHHLLSATDGRLYRLRHYVLPYLRGTRSAVRLVYNEPAVAALAGPGTILRHAWLTPTERFLQLPPLRARYDRALHLFPSQGALDASATVSSGDGVVIPNAVDSRLFAPVGEVAPPATLRVGYAGRWGRTKGLGVLLDAWPKVRAEVPDAELHLAGGQAVWPAVPGEEDLAARIARMRDEGVVAVGLLPREELPAFWSRMSVAVLPSTWVENFGNAILEAMACAVPAVVSASGGLPELVEDTGWVVPVGDADALARALVSATDAGTDRRRRARERALTYSRETRRVSLESLVATAASLRAGAAP